MLQSLLWTPTEARNAPFCGCFRALLAGALLLAVSVPTVAGCAVNRLDESSTPVETEEESQEKVEECLVGGQRRFRLRPCCMNRQSSASGHSHLNRVRNAGDFRVVEGHRLANGLLAPLTC